ncbi:MAG: hypothetical protein RM049_37765 [Nostoc sp. DedQUE04]|nr:hypothetical protein [Nostoc sp. DedQUE04]
MPNFLTPSIQSTAAHRQAVEQTFWGKHPQTPASRRNAHHSCPEYCPSPSTGSPAASRG